MSLIKGTKMCGMSNSNTRRTVKTADTVFDIIQKLQKSEEIQ